MSRWLWGGLAAGAVIVIVGLALSGQRREPGLAPFEVAGLMLAIPPDRVQDLEVRTPSAQRRFLRGADGRWTPADGGAAPADLHERIEAGLKFLHVTGPERTLAADELRSAPLADFGLEPPRLTVIARAGGAPAFAIHFGRANPLGLSRYARVEARPEVVLLPGHAADAWDRVAP